MGKLRRARTSKWSQRRKKAAAWRRASNIGLGALGLGLVVAFLWLVGPPPPKRATTLPAAAPSSSPASTVPPFYPSADAARSLPATLSPAVFSDPLIARVYRIAEQIPEVLAQQPCYCHCQRLGHRSLLDCHVTDHAAT